MNRWGGPGVWGDYSIIPYPNGEPFTNLCTLHRERASHMPPTDTKNDNRLVAETDLSGSAALSTTSFTLDKRDVKSLDDVAEELQISRSAALRQAIRLYLNTRHRASETGVLL